MNIDNYKYSKKDHPSEKKIKNERVQESDRMIITLSQNMIRGETLNSTRMNYFDHSSMKLKEDHIKRPLWISPDLHIFLETFSPLYRNAYEFLIQIAEPLSRPSFIHEYIITQYSLYAAMVLQLTSDNIKEILLKLAKNKVIPHEVSAFIDKNTQKYGSAKLFLKKHKKETHYYLEIFDKEILAKRKDNFNLESKLEKVIY